MMHIILPHIPLVAQPCLTARESAKFSSALLSKKEGIAFSETPEFAVTQALLKVKHGYSKEV